VPKSFKTSNNYTRQIQHTTTLLFFVSDFTRIPTSPPTKTYPLPPNENFTFVIKPDIPIPTSNINNRGGNPYYTANKIVTGSLYNYRE